MAREVTIMLGGEAGQGLQRMGQVLCRSLARSGLQLFAHQDFESRIRGGHSLFQIRTGPDRLDAHLDTVDILVALNEETVDLHRKQLAPHGLVIYDSDRIKTRFPGNRFLPLELSTVSKNTAGSSTMANTVAVGAVWAVIGMDLGLVEKVLGSVFGHLGAGMVKKNVAAARAGYKSGLAARVDALALDAPGGPSRPVLSGTEAVALGAIAAGCKFYSGYPMTPATGVMEFLAEQGETFGIVVEQAEDEIAAINMAIGASFMGVRSMVGTSGGGFSLMVEGLGLAGCTEIPLVILEAQRPGPATGMPTRTEQADLLFAIFASQGEFPRIVLAPGTPEWAFRLTTDAFNLADRYQTPVIVLSDHHLANAYWTVDFLTTDKVTVDRGVLASEHELASGADFLRYRFTDSGVSPRAWPGQGSALVVSTGDEHDQSGHISEDADTRTRMVDKRLGKMKSLGATSGLVGDIQPGADTVILGWGSSFGAVRETVDRLRAGGEKISMIHLHRLWPFPSAELEALVRGYGSVVVAENNSLGQMARLMRMETGIRATDLILKYDGRPFSVQDVLRYFD